MKKLVLFAAVILSMSAISCGNGEKGAAADSATDSGNKKDSIKTETQAGDTITKTIKNLGDSIQG